MISRGAQTKTIAILLVVVIVIAGAAVAWWWWSTRPKKVVLTVWLQWDVMPQEYYEKFEEKYNVELDIVKWSWTEYRAAILQAIETGTAPDVFWVDGPWIPEFVLRGWLEPVPDYIKEDVLANFTPGAIDNGWFQGDLYGVTQTISSHILVYNKKHFIEVGLDPNKPPSNITELYEYAKKLSKFDEEGNLIRAGYLQNIRDFYFGDLIHSHGGSLYSEYHNGTLSKVPAEATFWDEPGRTILETIAKLYIEDKCADVTWSLASTFLANTTSMIIVVGPWFLRDVYNTQLPFDIGVAPIPGPDPHSGDGGLTYVANKDSPNKELAWRFVQWIIDPEVMLAQCLATWQVPARISVQHDEVFLNAIPRPNETYPANLPTMEECLEAGIWHAAWTRPKTIHYGYISEQLWMPALSAALNPEQTPTLDDFRDKMEQLKQDINEVLARGESIEALIEYHSKVVNFNYGYTGKIVWQQGHLLQHLSLPALFEASFIRVAQRN